MKLSPLFKTLGLTTVLAISSSAILLVQPNKSIAVSLNALCRTVNFALANNQTLQPGDCVVSGNNFGSFTTSSVPSKPPNELFSGYFLILQNDGNLVLYHLLNKKDIKAIWASRTNGQTVTEVIMQDDGNLVIYGPSGALWASGTNGHPNSTLEVQDDGNMVIYQSFCQSSTSSSNAKVSTVTTCSGEPIWATNTNQ